MRTLKIAHNKHLIEVLKIVVCNHIFADQGQMAKGLKDRPGRISEAVGLTSYDIVVREALSILLAKVLDS